MNLAGENRETEKMSTDIHTHRDIHHTYILTCTDTHTHTYTYIQTYINT
jgi:hypothetical protein